MKILVTGANGLLGNAIFRLFGDTHEIVGTGRGDRRPGVLPNIPYFSCDLESEESVSDLMNEVAPDVIIHGAAMTQVDQCELNPEDCHRANVTATKNLISNCKSSVRFVFLSTDFVFDGTEPLYKETDVPNPVSVYGKSKLDAEVLVANSGLSYATLRTMLVYGYAPELSRTNIVLWVKSSLEAGKTITVVDDQFRTPTLVDNLAEACLLAANSKACGVFHISSETYLSMFDFANQVADLWGLDKGLIKRIDTPSLGQPAKRPPATGFSVEKAKADLGFVPVSVADGLAMLKSRMELA
ncbi:MAG: NAD(P)-dependent oxidoreductase [Cryomorphaceae bacterium]|nr:NAD(P)-dependent oxidoreductase [Cryomorphaceae bacterium]